MVNLRINQTFSTGSVRNARRMNRNGMNAVWHSPRRVRRKTAPTGMG